MSLAENLKEATSYLKPFVMVLGAFFGLIILAFMVSSFLGIPLDDIIPWVILISFLGILGLAVREFF